MGPARFLAVGASLAFLGVLVASCSSQPDMPGMDASVTPDTAPVGCPMGYTQCGSDCIATKRDPQNCGGCGKACKDGEVCVQGGCALQCGGSATKCGGACVDTKSNPDNCGMCGQKCPSGEVCNLGKCATSCQSGLTDCSGACIDLQTDDDNCGMCGNPCDAGQKCTNGKCAASCQAGWTACPNDGGSSCVNLNLDNSNCGACGVQCQNGQFCSPGADGGMATCGLACFGGTTKCGNKCVDTAIDPQNCGACGVPCNGTCFNGQCCSGQQLYCNGACRDTKTDKNNCGGCSIVCAGICNQGTCCGANDVVCNGQCANLQNDSNNCGQCGKVCPMNTPACSGGNCVSCGNDCWGSAGCLTKGGHCVKFACRAGSAAGTFCNNCLGWSEITYSDWMNGGYCLDVFGAFYAQVGMTAYCGSNNLQCCSTQQNCGSGNVAWHFFDGTDNHYTGPSMFSTPQTANCSAFAGIDNSAYVRLSACKKF
jgi:hypothetical protein